MSETITIEIETYADLVDDDARCNVLKRFCQEEIEKTRKYNEEHDLHTAASLDIRLIYMIMGWFE